MKSLLLTLFYTKKGLNLLDEEYEDDLFRKSLLIFSIYGIIKFWDGYKQQNNENEFLLNLLFLTIFGLLSVIMGLVFSYILYKIGKWIEGKANFTEIFSLFAYSFFPIIIGLVINRLLKKMEYLEGGYNDMNISNFVVLLSLVLSIKILFQGLVKFNKYGIKKAIFNLLVLIGLIIGMVFLRPFLIIK